MKFEEGQNVALHCRDRDSDTDFSVYGVVTATGEHNVRVGGCVVFHYMIQQANMLDRIAEREAAEQRSRS